MKKHLMALFLLFLFSFSIAAQEVEIGKHELSVWGGFSPDSVDLWGSTDDARFGIVGLRYARRFATKGNVDWRYMVDLVPFAALNYPDFEQTGTRFPRTTPVRPTRRAFGFSPIGFQANFLARKKIQPFVGFNGGILFFNKDIPNSGGVKLHFTPEGNAGLEFRLKNKRALTVGYKYYHISNAYRGERNPGFDNNIFYVGYTFFGK